MNELNECFKLGAINLGEYKSALEQINKKLGFEKQFKDIFGNIIEFEQVKIFGVPGPYSSASDSYFPFKEDLTQYEIELKRGSDASYDEFIAAGGRALLFNGYEYQNIARLNVSGNRAEAAGEAFAMIYLSALGGALLSGIKAGPAILAAIEASSCINGETAADCAAMGGGSGKAIYNAFKKPLKIEYIPTNKGASFRFTGNDAVIVINPQGQLITTWAINKKGVRG